MPSCLLHCRKFGAHWEFDISDSTELRLHNVRPDQQYETPTEVYLAIQAVEPFDFDAQTTSLSALCPSYCDLEADIFLQKLHDRTIFVNPAYGMRLRGIGCSGIGDVLDKLVNGDARQRGCNVVALLPSWTHADWFGTHVLKAHRIYHITSLLKFPNLFMPAPVSSPYNYPFVVAVW